VLEAEKVANGIRKMTLQADDQTFALRDFSWLGSVSLKSPQLGDVGAQVSDQSVDGPLVGH
jgi:hypothetical protein